MSGKKTTGKGKAPAAAGVRIRMYNVGFGDCFLLTFPGAGRPRQVLIDCGFHSYGPPPTGLDAVVRAVIQDVTIGGKAEIDVVIATHRHKDHVYGFENPAWKKVSVSEVWMPWTEHPTDPEARKIREAQAKKAKRIKKALDRMKQLGLLGAARHARASAVLSNSHFTNEAAMDTLHRGFADKALRLFLPQGKDIVFPQKLESKHLPNVTVHILGPGRDKEIIRDMEPPPSESFMRFAGEAEADTAARLPFDLKRWGFSPQRKVGPASKDPLFGWLEERMADSQGRGGKGAPPPYGSREFASYWVQRLKLTPATIRGIEEASRDDEFAAVVALEAAVNGTSLLLAFEFENDMLIFPGDAQWGTWKQALQNPASRDLLSRATFYKVGHHGSHNATPKEFVEKVARKGVLDNAMVSTKATKQWQDIPRKPLLDELEGLGVAIARSDGKSVPPAFQRVDAIRTDLVL
ncbi:MAG: hypothetical protein K1Y01_07065 [Vicinamibacteria bacterium]|nr:hypothetical protein [Vicinamibacteria bacterium]